MMFDTTVKRLGMNQRIFEKERASPEPTTFRRPPPKTGQLPLF